MVDDFIAGAVAFVFEKFFKGRPTCAFLAFAGFVAAVIGVLLFRAQDSSEFIFALFCLIFIMIIVLPRVRHMINQEMIRDMQASDTTPAGIEEGILDAGELFELEEPMNEIEAAPFESAPLSPGTQAQSHEVLPQPTGLTKSSWRLINAILAALVAGVFVWSILFIATFSLPTNSHEEIMGVTYLMYGICIFAAPAAAILGVLINVIVTKIARRRNTEEKLNPVGLLTAGIIGLVLGIAAAQYMVNVFYEMLN